VNASWEDLLAIDASADVAPVGAWTFRAKHFLRVRNGHAHTTAPSATIVLGEFGDVVNYRNNDVFLSWYPVGRQGIWRSLQPPPSSLHLTELKTAEVRTGIYQALCRIMPGLSGMSDAVADCEVKGGIIYALGDTDIHDPASRLHERHSVGPRSFGHYHTVNTGKYTLAPLFAMRLADRIMGTSNGY
jgi:hypothetical protein